MFTAVLQIASQSAITFRHRVASVDAYRGLVMFLMLGEVLHTCDVSAALPASRFWRFVCFQQTHAAWVGCSLHDLIQPSFYFLVGVGLFLSMRRRASSGQTRASLAWHAIARSLTLILLGMLLVAVHPRLVWMQVGVREDETAERLEAAGIPVVMDRCLAVDHYSLGG